MFNILKLISDVTSVVVIRLAMSVSCVSQQVGLYVKRFLNGAV